MFEHHIMAKASARILDSRVFAFTGQDQAVVQKLRLVALRFGQLQEKRHTADYDNAEFWTPTEALEDVKKAADAFSNWQSIKNEKIAKDYLVSLLIKPHS